MKSSNIYNEFDDKKIKKALEYKANSVNVSDDMKFSINKKINGGYNMKFKLKKSYVAITAALVFVTAATGIIASSKITSWTSHSSILDNVNNLPDNSTFDSIGYNFKFVENFDNGFSFSNYRVVEAEGLDKDENGVITLKEVYCDYNREENGKSKKLTFIVNNEPEALYKEGKSESNIEKTINFNGIDIIYSDYIYKAFPPDLDPADGDAEQSAEAKKLMDEVGEDAQDITRVYKYLSDEEIEAYKKGKLMLAYGSQEIETMRSQHISWYDDGISYSFMYMGEDVNDYIEMDELISMAKQVIEK